MKNHHVLSAQQLNYFAIELLDFLGNKNPTQKQIDILEELLIAAIKEYQIPPSNLSSNLDVERLYLITINKISETLVSKLKIDLSSLHKKSKVREQLFFGVAKNNLNCSF